MIRNIKFKRFFLPLMLSVVFQLPVMAITSRTYTLEKGLTNTRISALYQDSRLNVWISTENGLNRFDGLRINGYHHMAEDRKSLANDQCHFVFESSDRVVFVATESGIQTYSYDFDCFENVPMIRLDGDTAHVPAVCMIELSDGSLVVSTRGNGVYHFVDGEFHESLQFQLPRGTEYVFSDSKGRIWLSDVNGDIYLGSRCVGHVPSVTNIVESQSGYVYIGSVSGGVFRYEEQSCSLKQVVKGEYQLTAVKACNDGHLILCTDGNGVRLFDEETTKTSRLSYFVSRYHFSESSVRDAMYDCYGNLWLGVCWRGVEVIPGNYVSSGGSEELWSSVSGLGMNAVTAMKADTNRHGRGFWTGVAHYGIYWVDASGKRGVHYDGDDVHGMPRTVLSILPDGNGCIWLGTPTDGALLFDEAKKDIVSLSAVSGQKTTEMKAVNDIVKDRYSRIWFATYGSGLYCLDTSSDKKSLKRYTAGSYNQNGVLDNMYLNCLAVSEDRIFVGTMNGLESFVMDNGELSPAGKILDGISVFEVVLSGTDCLLAGTSNGLFVIDIEGTTLEMEVHYSVNEGLVDNHVGTMETDADGVIWVGTDRGISRIDAENGIITNYSVAEGLPADEISARASVFTDGRLFFGHTNGIVDFIGNDIPIQAVGNSLPGDLRVANLLLNGKPINSINGGSSHFKNMWVPESNLVRLSYGERSFGLELTTMNACLNYIHYSYRIDGGDWIELLEKQQSVNVSNIGVGRHTIDIISKECDGMFTLNVKAFRPWYVSYAAVGCYLLVMAVSLLLAYNSRRQKDEAIKTNEQLKHEVELVRNMKRVDELNVDSPDDQFMQRVMRIINENMSNSEMNVEFLADKIGISRAHFYRKLKSITNLSPVDFLKNIRLKEAARLLVEKNCDVQSTSQATGFKSVSAFSTAFKHFYNMTPSQFMKLKRSGNDTVGKSLF